MKFSKETMAIFTDSFLSDAFASAKKEGFDGDLTEFNDLAKVQFNIEWENKDKATSDFFNY